MKPRDLGTYHVCVRFSEGRGFIFRWNTGARYTDGTVHVSPLSASRIPPGYEGEEDLAGLVVYQFREGNYSCDCNLRDFLADAAQKPRPLTECGDELVDAMTSIDLIRPDGSKFRIWGRS